MRSPAQQFEELLDRYRSTEGLCAADGSAAARDDGDAEECAASDPGAMLAMSRLRMLQAALAFPFSG